jgi:uncharacterized protein (TIGR02449 family)
MDPIEFVNLELQIESLLQTYEKLRSENNYLRQRLTKLTQERAELLDRNKKATVKIKRIISQLRSEIQ